MLLIATGFGVGYCPIVPGTMGTLLAIPLCLVLSYMPSPVYALTTVALFFLSVWASEEAQSYWGRKDDRRIVIDEIIGFFITMLWLPRTTWFFILGFFLFRLFDIIKPPPLRRLENVRGGYGVVLDDVGAGVYANIVLQIGHLLWR